MKEKIFAGFAAIIMVASVVPLVNAATQEATAVDEEGTADGRTLSAPTERVQSKSVAVRHEGKVYFFDLWMDGDGYVTGIDNGIGVPENLVDQTTLENIPTIIEKDGGEITPESAVGEKIVTEKQLTTDEKAEVAQAVKQIINSARNQRNQIVSGESSLAGKYTVGDHTVTVETSGNVASAGEMSLQLSGSNALGIECDIYFGFFNVANVTIDIWWLNLTVTIPILLPYVLIYNCTITGESSSPDFGYTHEHDLSGELQSTDAWYIR